MKVINKRSMPFDPTKDRVNFPVDRSTPLGNPYLMTSEVERDKVCDMYIGYFNSLVHDMSSNLWRYLENIIKAYLKNSNIGLVCWCAPKRCHADTIKSFIMTHLGVIDQTTSERCLLINDAKYVRVITQTHTTLYRFESDTILPDQSHLVRLRTVPSGIGHLDVSVSDKNFNIIFRGEPYVYKESSSDIHPSGDI